MPLYRLLILPLLLFGQQLLAEGYYYPPSPYPNWRGEYYRNPPHAAQVRLPPASDRGVTPTAPTKKGSSPNNHLVHDKIQLALRRGNFAEAYYYWRPLAEAGDAEAQFGLGWMYHNGYGLAIDDQIAAKWWQQAAEQNHGDAALALATLYHHGEGAIETDIERALSYYRQAALAGHEDVPLIPRQLAEDYPQWVNPILRELAPAIPELHETQFTIEVALANIRSGPGTDHTIV
ncbi:MAG: sel1 repeat family protein, partial [Gammaproteobacteria bacterium]|nr:sel1 repeat family protein [Gammaproteobacteria bacterium]